MGDASEVLYKLKPVTFKFKKNLENPVQNLDYGLIAEDVAEVDPKLAIRDGKGQIESVRYMAIYNMMLNEFIKEHRKVQEQEATIAQLKEDFRATVAELNARLKEQPSQIQKVSAQLATASPSPGGLEGSKPALHVVVNTP